MPRLILFFTYSLLLALSLPIIWPSLNLIYFAPFLVITFYKHRKGQCLWLAVLCGTCIDLLSSHTRLGFYALTYFLTVEMIYSQQNNFFEGRLSTLPVMTFLFSFISTLIQVPLLYIFGEGIHLSFEWITNDLILYPFYDALYAMIAFTLPTIAFLRRSKQRPSSMLRFKERM